MESKLHNDFYSLIESVLQDAGCTFRYLESGRLLVANGDMQFAIDHCVASPELPTERVCLVHFFRDMRIEELFENGVTLIVNKLSGINPEFNIACTNDARMRIRYDCDILEAKDFIPHMNFACEHFADIEAAAKQQITDMHVAFQLKNNSINPD